MSHWLDKVIDLLTAETYDLRELALIANSDPRTFYRGVDPKCLDVTQHSITGIEFTNVAGQKIDEIRSKTNMHERLTMILDLLLQNQSDAKSILESYRDKSKYANLSLEEMYDVLVKDQYDERFLDITLLKAMRRPLHHQLPQNRANLYYYMAKNLTRYPNIKTYLKKSYDNLHSYYIERYRFEIETFLS